VTNLGGHPNFLAAVRSLSSRRFTHLPFTLSAHLCSPLLNSAHLCSTLLTSAHLCSPWLPEHSDLVPEGRVLGQRALVPAPEEARSDPRCCKVPTPERACSTFSHCQMGGFHHQSTIQLLSLLLGARRVKLHVLGSSSFGRT
jgi:hypothetical protein